MVSGGIVRVLCNNIRAPDSGILMDSVFPRKSDRGKVVGWTRLLERGPSFCNHFIDGAFTGVAVIGIWWWLGRVCWVRKVRGVSIAASSKVVVAVLAGIVGLFFVLEEIG